MKSYVLFSVFVLVVLSAACQQADLPPNGRWQGAVTSQRSFYTVIMDVKDCSLQTVCGSTDYPDIPCGEELTFLEESNGVYRFSARTVYGREICSVDGTITIELNETGQWIWTWYYPDGLNRGNRAIVEFVPSE